MQHVKVCMSWSVSFWYFWGFVFECWVFLFCFLLGFRSLVSSVSLQSGHHLYYFPRLSSLTNYPPLYLNSWFHSHSARSSQLQSLVLFLRSCFYSVQCSLFCHNWWCEEGRKMQTSQKVTRFINKTQKRSKGKNRKCVWAGYPKILNGEQTKQDYES